MQREPADPGQVIRLGAPQRIVKAFDDLTHIARMVPNVRVRHDMLRGLQTALTEMLHMQHTIVQHKQLLRDAIEVMKIAETGGVDYQGLDVRKAMARVWAAEVREVLGLTDDAPVAVAAVALAPPQQPKAQLYPKPYPKPEPKPEPKQGRSYREWLRDTFGIQAGNGGAIAPVMVATMLAVGGRVMALPAKSATPHEFPARAERVLPRINVPDTRDLVKWWAESCDLHDAPLDVCTDDEDVAVLDD